MEEKEAFLGIQRMLILLLSLSLLFGVEIEANADAAEKLFPDFDISELYQLDLEDPSSDANRYISRKFDWLAGQYYICGKYVIYADEMPLCVDEDSFDEFSFWGETGMDVVEWAAIVTGKRGDTEEIINSIPRVENMDFSKPLTKERLKHLNSSLQFEEEHLISLMQIDDVNKYLWLASYRVETIRWGDWLLIMSAPPPTFEKEKDPWYIRQGEWAYKYYANKPEYMKQVQEDRYKEVRQEFGYGDLWEIFFEEHPEALYLNDD